MKLFLFIDWHGLKTNTSAEICWSNNIFSQQHFFFNDDVAVSHVTKEVEMHNLTHICFGDGLIRINMDRKLRVE